MLNHRWEKFALEFAETRSAATALARSGIPASPPMPEGFYVYVLIDEQRDEVFYVGKGVRRRMYQHVSLCRAGQVINAAKDARIRRLLDLGMEPKPICLCEAMTSRDALNAERWLIKTIGKTRLTNYSSGTYSPEERAAQFERRLDTFCAVAKKNTDKPYWEHLYWGVIAGLGELQGKKSKIPAMAHLKAMKLRAGQSDNAGA